MSGSPVTPTPADAGSDAALQTAMEHFRLISKTRARNFYYGMKLMPPPRRWAMYTLYAFMRVCDDLADAPAPAPGSSPGSPGSGPGSSPGSAHAGVAGSDVAGACGMLRRFRGQMTAVLTHEPLVGEPALPPTDPLWAAFAWMMRTYPIDVAHLHAMLDGQEMDLSRHTYARFDDLRDYCYKVASTVGLACLDIWGYTGGPSTQALAVDRGIALQLTNILRDVVEDAQRGRVYLPADELAQFGYESPEAFIAAITPGASAASSGGSRPGAGDFAGLMRFQLSRAQQYYAASASLESRIDPACRPTCWAMMRIYHGLLGKIERDPQRVLTSRVRLSSLQKARIALRATFGKSFGPAA